MCQSIDKRAQGKSRRKQSPRCGSQMEQGKLMKRRCGAFKELNIAAEPFMGIFCAMLLLGTMIGDFFAMIRS